MQKLVLLFGLLWVPFLCAQAIPDENAPRYRVAVCDWMILKRQKPGAFALAKIIGADGVEVDMGSLGNRETFDSVLGDPIAVAKFRDTSRDKGVAISSLAMSGFYAQSFAERANFERPLNDAIEAAKALDVTTIFLPLGVQNDLIKHPELRPLVVKRLKIAEQLAQKVGVTIAIETALDATGEAQLLDEIGSPNVRSYFNFANALQNGRDVVSELRILGRDRIAQIHCTDADGVWLQNNPRLDLPAVKAALDAMGWRGWLVLERSRDAKDPTNVVWNFSANAAYVKQVFGAQTTTSPPQ